MRYITFLLIALPSIVFGQSAVFMADTTDLWARVGQRKDLLNEVKEMEWRIQGKVLSFGSKPVKISPEPNSIDTVFYRHHRGAKWDTLICSIRKPMKYRFVYNECCDGFNVIADKKGIDPKVRFRIKGSSPTKKILGTLGEAGMLVTQNKRDTLSSHCRSAMAPGVYSVALKEIVACSEAEKCKGYVCLVSKGKVSDFEFKTVATKFEMHFLPLDSDPIEVLYDLRADKVYVK